MTTNTNHCTVCGDPGQAEFCVRCGGVMSDYAHLFDTPAPAQGDTIPGYPRSPYDGSGYPGYPEATEGYDPYLANVDPTWVRPGPAHTPPLYSDGTLPLSPKKSRLPWIIGGVFAAVLLVGGVIAALTFLWPTVMAAIPAPPTTKPTQPGQPTAPPSTQTEAPTSEPQTPDAPPSTPTSTVPPERAAAAAELAAQRERDLSTLTLSGKWGAQLASKHAGIVDNLQTTSKGSHTFYEEDIWEEHQALKARLSGTTLVLVQATDFGKQRERPYIYWVTIADLGMSSSNEVKAWCATAFADLPAAERKNACLPRQMVPPYR